MSPISRLLAFALFLTLLPSSSSAAPEEAVAGESRDWLAEKAAFYASHPELKTTPGSGWKPYNRIKWEHDLHFVNGEAPAPGARWDAWLQNRDRFDAGISSRAAWFQLGPENFAGRMLAIAFHPLDPNTVYAGAAGGGLWRTTDAGTSWTPLTDHLPTPSVGGVAVSLTNPDIIVIGTGELPTGLVDGISGIGILRSTDGGASWETTSLTNPRQDDAGFHIVEAGPNGTFLAGTASFTGTTDGLWRSSDDGATWTQVRVGGDYYDVKWKPGDPNTVYTVKGDDGSGNNVKISTDDGLTWSKAGTGQPFSFQIGKSKIAVTPADPEVIYAIYEDQAGTSTTGLYRSTDGGATWEARNTSTNVGGQQGWYNLSLAADPNDPNVVITGGVRLYRSSNGGTNLSIVGQSVHVDHHDARYQPGSPNDLWVACDGGIWESTNDGQGGWSGKNAGLITYQFYDICVAQSDAARIAGGTQDNGTDIRNGTNIWSSGLGGDGMVCNIDPTNSDIMYGETQFGGLHKSTNGGSSWFPIQNGMPSNAGLWVTPVDLDPNDPQHLYTMRSTTAPGTYRSRNGGGSWTQVSPEAAKSISISPVDGNVVWILSATAIYTTDDGDTWTAASPYPFPTGGELRILAHPTDVASAFATFAGFSENKAHIAYTTDFGVTWSDVSGNLPAVPVRAIAIDPLAPDHWYIGGDLAVWASTNGGAHWGPYASSLPVAVVWDLEIQVATRKLVAGTHGRGAWEVDITPPLSTSSPEVAGAPRDLMLDPPAPNPARDHVLLRWASRRVGEASLDVYDVHGRLVSRLAERSTGDGIIRHATWLLDDVSAGVYFAVVEADGERLSRKIVVVD